MRLSYGFVAGCVGLLAGIGQADNAPPFAVGEKLHYKIFWGILEVGSATLEVREMTDLKGHAVYRIVGTTRSNSFLDKIYPVSSSVETYLDVEGLFSRKFVEDRNEGSNSRQRETVLDYDKGQGIIQGPNRRTPRTFPLEKPAQDGFSSIYYLRTQPLSPNSKQTFTSLASRETCEVSLTSYEQKQISVGRLGKFPAIRVEPSADYEGFFTREGGMTVWVSADDRKVPLLVNCRIKAGSVRAVLTKVETADGQVLPAAQGRAAEGGVGAARRLLPRASQ